MVGIGGERRRLHQRDCCKREDSESWKSSRQANLPIA
jgi:hypothetical protein